MVGCSVEYTIDPRLSVQNIREGGRRKSGNICEKCCQIPVRKSGGTNQIAE